HRAVEFPDAAQAAQRRRLGTSFTGSIARLGLGRGKPRRAPQQKLEIALTTYGLSDKKSFRKNLKLALDRGLSEDDALAALTTVPANLCGVEKQLGTIEKG